MSSQKIHCWTLERVPPDLATGPPFVLDNSQEKIRVGRRETTNDKVCIGANVSRNHLQFVRDAGSGNGEDWRQISWSVMDLGGMCGTYINRNKIEPNRPRVLNDGDLVGVGCPEEKSSRSEKLEKFVFRIRAPEAYRAPLREGVLDHDCPTPPPQHAEDDLETAPSVNLPDVVPGDKSSQESSDSVQPHAQHSSNINTVSSEPQKDGASDIGSPVILSSKKRRVKRLLSSSEEDDDEVKEIKNLAKRIKTKSEPEPLNPILIRKVSIGIPILKMPKRAVSAKVGPDLKILEWKTLSTRDYRRVTRAWAGLNPDGSQGTPLLQALEPDDPEDDGLSDVSSGEMPGINEVDKEVMDMELSYISSDDEAIKVTAESHNSDSELVKITYGANLNSKPIIVKAEPQQFMNYSMNDDAAVITLLDSDDEEEYNQSQNLLLDDAYVSDTNSNSDKEFPGSRRAQDVYKSDEDISDILDSDSEQDDDEIQILNESQTSLYNKIFNKVAVKPEPVDPPGEEVNKEEENIRKELLQTLNAEPESSSLLAGPESNLDLDEENLAEPDKSHIDDIVNSVQGADRAMVMKIYRRLDLLVMPDDLLAEVIQECESILVMKIAIQHNMAQRLVKLALLDLKGEDRDSMVLEQDLDNSVFMKKHHNLLKETELEFNYSTNALKEALFKLKERNQEVSKENLVSEVLDQEEVEKVVSSLASKLKMDKIGVRETVLKVLKLSGKIDEKSAEKLLLHENASNRKTSGHEDQSSEGNLSTNLDGSQHLVDAFGLTEEKAKEVLKNVNNDINKAGEAILDTLEDDVPLEPENHPPFGRSRSPDLTDDDSVDDLLKDDDEGDCNSKPEEKNSAEIPGPSKSFPAKSKAERGPLIIAPPHIPVGRGHLRGVSAESIKTPQDIFKNNEASKKAVKSKPADLKKRKDPVSVQPAAQSHSNDDLKARRMEKLKRLSESKEKKTDGTNAPSTSGAGVMKTSTPRAQKLLLEMQESGTPVPKRRSDNAKDSHPKPRERRTSVSEASSSGRTRKPSGNFLEAEEAAVLDKTEKAKKEKYASTGDGYKAMKKMSVHNVDYNIMSQDISKMPIKAKPLKFSGIFPEPPKATTQKTKKKLRWRDETGLENLTDVRLIEPHNKGIKCGPGNKDLMAPISVGREGNKRKPNKDIDMSNVFKVILEWNCAWPKEQKKNLNKEPPPVQGPYKLLPLPSSFSNLPEYQQIFLPLMFHEIYSSVFEEYDENADSVPVCVQEVARDTTQLFTIVRCISLLTDQEMRSDIAAEGSLIELKLSYGTSVSKGSVIRIIPCLGYVQQTTKHQLGDINSWGEMDRERLNRLISAAQKKKRSPSPVNNVVIYTIKCKLNVINRPETPLYPEKPIYLKFLSRIKPELRKFEALLSLSKSPLQPALVSPKTQFFKTGLGTEHLHATIKDIPSLSKLNAVQKRSIVSVARNCIAEPQNVNVSLLQGPPGTGKSSTIVGLLLQILYASLRGSNRETFPRILVVAPSNAAVDEMARKLISARKQLNEKIRFRMVRLGVKKSMHEDVKKFSLDENIERIVLEETRKKKAVDTLEKDIETKQKQANALYDEKVLAENDGNQDLANKKNRDYMELQNSIKRIKNEMSRPLNSKEKKQMTRDAEDKTLAGADIILSTMSSSVGKEVDRFFVQGVTSVRSAEAARKISVCVMDEASQCVEPESLIPLKLGFKKLVMVGDHEQLQATVTSNKARQLGYQQSLFGRLHSFLTGGCHIDQDNAGSTPPMVNVRCPVLRLETQYRMHPEIALWPNRYFYGGVLKNGDTKHESKVVPFLLLHVDGNAVIEKGNCYNKSEEKAIIDLIKTMRDINGKTPNLGVITFYSKQKTNISLELQNQRLSGARIAVNTVDGFQGSEKDVILISCVRGGQGGIGFLADRQRLNVALTRARKTLIVVGNMETLGRDSLWADFIANAKERNFYKNYSDISNLSSVLKT